MKYLRSCYVAVKEEEVLFSAENPEELYKKANGDFSDIKVLWMTKDGTAQEVDVEEEFELYNVGKPVQTVKCPNCGEDTERFVDDACICNKCDIIINLDNLCPDCGAYTYEANDPSNDLTMGIYCSNSHKTISNQFMDYEDFLDDEDYKDCDKIVKESFKKNVAYNLASGNYVQAYKDILTMQNNSDYECAENECDGCPISSMLTELEYRGQFNSIPTCEDFRVAFALTQETPVYISRASEASDSPR